MKPTKKAKEIDEAAQKRICVRCKQPIGEFRDELTTISGFCQKCQDETFGVNDA